MNQLELYLQRVSTMQDKNSNKVYVVSLSKQTFPSGDGQGETSFIDVVEKYRRYFHPIKRDFPRQPPNYMGFRYSAHLKSIHKVEGWEIFNNFGLLENDQGTQLFPNQPKKDLDWNYYLYHLGPPIIPINKIRTEPPGEKKFRARRVLSDIDLLLTSSTIAEAIEETKKREKLG